MSLPIIGINAHAIKEIPIGLGFTNKINVKDINDTMDVKPFKRRINKNEIKIQQC